MGKTNKLLELLVRVRTNRTLDRAAEEDRIHKAASEEQDKAFEELFNAGLSKEQKRIVDRALSAASQCGVAYGKVAYRLGLHDGIRLMTEIKTIRSLFF